VEGNTLVVDDVNFTDDTWIAGGGTFHSQALHVTERLTRRGDSLLYEVTVEDPMVLTGPWKMQPRTLKVSDTPLEEAPPCKDMDQLISSRTTTTKSCNVSISERIGRMPDPLDRKSNPERTEPVD